MNEDELHENPEDLDLSGDGRFDKLEKLPSLVEAFLITFSTILFILFITFIFALLSSVFELGNEFLLMGVGIVIPAMIYLKFEGYSFKYVFRLNSISAREVTATLIIGISLVIVINFAEALTQYLPLPDWYENSKEMFEGDLVNQLAIGSVYSFIILVLSVVVIAAVCEEMFFRGFLQQVFERKFPVGMAIIVSALMFAILHPLSLIPIIIFAVFLGILSWKANSIYPTMIIHAMNNGITLFMLNLSGTPDETADYVEIPIYLFVLSLMVLIAGIRYYFVIVDEKNENYVVDNKD
ncbi:type II CAAX prenyl endopeptidase Rce1 family protein [candidate division KSB1 bacterium]